MAAEQRDSSDSLEISDLEVHTDLSACNTLGVGIFSHAVVITSGSGKGMINKNFPGVHIKKQNIAAYGSISVGEFATGVNKPHGFFSKARDTIHFLESCIDTEKYLRSMGKYLYDEGSYQRLHNPEGACKLFDGYKKYYEKIYSFDDTYKHIIFVLGRVCDAQEINIVSCNLFGLCIFFCQNYTTYPFEELYTNTDSYNTDSYKTNSYKYMESLNEEEKSVFLSVHAKILDILDTCSEFITERDERKKITTTQIFKLIALARDHLSIDKANILDTSCNVVYCRTSDPNDSCHGCSVSANGFTPAEDVAWGGKSKKRRKSKSKRTRRKRKV